MGQEDTTKTKELSEVVVSTGQYKPQSIKNSVYQVRVIGSERIKLRGATNVQQVLNNELGFRFSNDNTLGTTDVQLLGMSGRNVKILLDGVPMIDRGDIRESLNQVDINTIERIEIVEGPMSVSYGSDALAGVINLITKKSHKDQWSINARIQEETAGDEYYPFSYKGVHNQSVSGTWNKSHWNFSAGFTHNDADGYGGDEYGRDKTWKPKEQWLTHARIGYATSKFSIYYRLDGLDETIIGRGRINYNNYKAIDQQFITDRFMHQVQSDWRISDRWQWNSVAAYTDYKRRTKTTRHDFEKNTDELTNGEGEQDVSKFNSLMFRNTFQYRISNTVSLQPGLEVNREEANGARIKGSPVITDYALFVSAELKPTQAINIRPGLRFIKNSVYDAPPVIPSINTKFALSKEWDLRAAYAYGFRAPALRELYFDYHDANHNIIGNPDLKAEHSNSFSASLNWTSHQLGAVKVSASLGGFYNQFNNLINYAASATDSTLFVTVNIDKFKTTGGTLETKAIWKQLSATLGFSYIGRYNEVLGDDTYKSDDLPQFVWSPEVNSNIVYNIKKWGTNLGLFYKFTGKKPSYQAVENRTTGQEEVILANVQSFNWMDFTVSQPVYKYFTVTAGVKNIFDVTSLDNTVANTGSAHSSSGPVPLSYGRSYFLGLIFQWNKK